MKTTVERQLAVLAEWIANEQQHCAEEGTGPAVLELLQSTHTAVAGGTALDYTAIDQLASSLYDASMVANPDAVCGDTDLADNVQYELRCTLWRYQPVREEPNKDNPQLIDTVMLDTRTGAHWRLEGAAFMDWDMANDDDEWPDEDLIESGWKRMEDPIPADQEISEE